MNSELQAKQNEAPHAPPLTHTEAQCGVRGGVGGAASVWSRQVNQGTTTKEEGGEGGGVGEGGNALRVGARP